MSVDDTTDTAPRRGVISMLRRSAERQAAPLRLVERYWASLRGADAVPLRSQIDPRAIEGALDCAFLAERIAPNHARLRVAGRHLTDLMGMDVSGMPLSTLIAPQDRDGFGASLGRVFADPAVLRVSLRGEGGFGKPRLDAEMVVLPLRSDFGEVSRAIGVVATTGRIGRTPRRFRVDASEIVPAFGALSDSPATTETTPQTEPLRGLSEAHAPFRPAKPYLRVVVSND
ncbi:PAS domain-containing protein [Thalassococcus sp. CAU 1522]|uniref:PAS domain-containing protein n=1 Tax=Thalassococcus arenae TaxID=2851652 RepID=A0ABS6NA97_9RHOB|nr:PAS domain-containing protein [Thalassococcus arenae]MBV2360953.1 PAS domain-containing protein [Thalassococcus arenae]